MRNPASRNWRFGAALVLGLLFTAAQVFVGFRSYEYVGDVTHGPHEALAAGIRGDYDQFRASFAGGATSVDNAHGFIEQLESRYGKYISLVPPADVADALLALPNEPREYVITFENGSVVTVVDFEIATNLGPEFLKAEMTSMRILDIERGDLVWPPNGATLSPFRTATEPSNNF